MVQWVAKCQAEECSPRTRAALKGGLAVPRIPPAPWDSEPDLLVASPTLRDQKWKQDQPMCTRNLARPGGRPRSNLTVEVVCVVSVTLPKR